MTNKLRIDEVDPRIAEWHQEWERNRDMISGERAIKSRRNAEKYLPREKGLDDPQFENMVRRTLFFPGAARTHQGLKGLIFQTPAVLTAPDSVKDILNTITFDGFTIDDLAEDVVSEHLAVNFGGLMTDYPVSNDPISRSEAIAAGIRPFISFYSGESILGIETGTINNRMRITRVRLQEDENTIRELRLDDGVYSVNRWGRTEGAWAIFETLIPIRKGQPLNEIPFSLVTTNRRPFPEKAQISDVCAVNAQHYIASANLATADFWVSHPTPYVFGAKVEDLDLTPGSFITSEAKGTDVKIGMLEYVGASMTNLENRVRNTANDMAKVGSRILAPERDAVEAAETVAIKTAVENAILAMTARLVNRWLNDQLKWVAWWLELPEGAIRYELNTEYGISKLTVEEAEFLFAQCQAGLLSRDAYLNILIAGQMLPETHDIEVDAAKINQEVADRPPTDV